MGTGKKEENPRSRMASGKNVYGAVAIAPAEGPVFLSAAGPEKSEGHGFRGGSLWKIAFFVIPMGLQNMPFRDPGARLLV